MYNKINMVYCLSGFGIVGSFLVGVGVFYLSMFNMGHESRDVSLGLG